MHDALGELPVLNLDMSISRRENCISEKLVMSMADAMVAGGYKEAGYEYVSIDGATLFP